MSIKPDTNTWSGIEMEAGVSPMNIVPDTKHDSVGNDDGSHGGEDFVLTGRSAWLRIDGYSLYIHNKPQTLSVMLFPLKEEADDPVAEFNFEKDAGKITSFKISKKT